MSAPIAFNILKSKALALLSVLTNQLSLSEEIQTNGWSSEQIYAFHLNALNILEVTPEFKVTTPESLNMSSSGIDVYTCTTFDNEKNRKFN